jgi:hypothetical protein
LLAACGQGTPTPVASAPTIISKILVTVYISPTPNKAQRQATLAVNPPTPTPAPPTLTPLPSPYVGVFLGEAEVNDSGPVIYPALVNNPPTQAVTPVPTVPVAPTCAFTPDTLFGASWATNVSAKISLGCPIQAAAEFRGALQVFERGVMYWRGDTDEIWAIATSGLSAGRYWYVQGAPQAATDGLTAPEGLRVPVRGFGTVWRTTPGVRDALGYARLDEQETAMNSQRFDGGLLFDDRSSGQVFILLVNGTAYGPY